MQFSYSRVECFKKCPYQFKLRYVDKLKCLPDDDPQNALFLGKALHTGIEKNVDSAIDEYYSNYSIITDSHIAEALKLEYLLTRAQLEKIIPDGIHELEIDLPDYKGFIDLLVPVDENTYDLYDFKYSNNIDNYVNCGQLHVYKYYFEQSNPGKSIRNLYFIFFPKAQLRLKYKNKTNKRDETQHEFRQRIIDALEKKEIEIIKIDYDYSKVKEFQMLCDEILKCENYKKEPSRLCDWCEYKNLCEKGDTTMILPKNERRQINLTNKKVIWLYGAPFSGKTFLANQFDDPLMLNTDGNIKFIDAPYVAIKDEVSVEGRLTKRKLAWESFKEAITELEKNENDFKTIVVDLLEDMYEHCRLYMYEEMGITHESDDSFRAWDKVRTEFLSTIKRLVNLDYNIVLISHEDSSKDITKKSGDKITSIKPNINEKVANKIAGMVDIVARVISDDENRVLSFKTNEVIFGGGRLNVKQNEIPLNYSDLMKIYTDNVTTEQNVTDKSENDTTIQENSQIEEVNDNCDVKEEVEEKPRRRRKRVAENE